MAKLLIVEDSIEAQKLLSISLQGLYEFETAASLADAKSKIQNSHFDLILLDLTLPDGDGLTLCEYLQKNHKNTPVIMVTAKGAVGDKVLGLVSGADDYIAKPFDPRELRARVESVLRRSKMHSEVVELAEVGPVTLNLKEQKARYGENEWLDLTPIEFRILVALGENPGDFFTRDDLYKKIWGGEVHVGRRNIDAHVCKLRKKLKPAGVEVLSKRGHGYTIEFARKAPATNKNSSESLPMGGRL